jgi:hypothetical protein
MIFKTPDNAKMCVKKSPLHGKGLFAQDFIPEGAILGTIRGIRTSKNGMYTLWVTEDRPIRMLCKFKYINHSDDPNVVLYDTMEVCALRDIFPGDEILHDYESGDWEESEDYEDEFTHIFDNASSN